MTIKIGSRVVLSKVGEDYWLDNESNPRGVVGTVTEDLLNWHGFDYRVQWDNGSHNAYREQDIVEFVDMIEETPKTNYVKAKRTKKGNIQLTMSEDMALTLRVISGSVLGSDKSPRAKADEIYYKLGDVIDDIYAWEAPEYKLIDQPLRFKDYPDEGEKAQ